MKKRKTKNTKNGDKVVSRWGQLVPISSYLLYNNLLDDNTMFTSCMLRDIVYELFGTIPS